MVPVADVPDTINFSASIKKIMGLKVLFLVYNFDI